MSASETILLVDSDPVVLRDLSAILQPRGYNLLTARHGVEAIRAYESSRTPVNLLITAVMMPGLSGFDIAESLTQWNRRLGVVFMSEHNREMLFAENTRGSAHFVRKPILEQTLLQKVSAAIAERRRPVTSASQVTAVERIA